MYKKFISAFKLFDTLLQAIYSLALPIGIGALASYLLTKYAACPPWIWAILLTVGSLVGLFSMMKFIISALDAQKRLEKSIAEEEEKRQEKERLHESLRQAAKDNLERKDNSASNAENSQDEKEGDGKTE